MRDYDGKTATERIAERRERLIDAGLLLFSEYGYAGTSIRMVLRTAGLRDRYFAESFTDLDSLLAAVYARLVADEVDMCRRAIEATEGSAAQRARAAIDMLIRSFERDRSRARIKLREVVSAGPASRRQRRKGMDEMAGIIAELLPGGTRRSRQLIGLSLVTATEELLLAWIDGERMLNRRAVVDMVMLLFTSVSDHMISEALELAAMPPPAVEYTPEAGLAADGGPMPLG